MGKDFDPYLKWLGVAPQDQPANHYRLLGIPELIDDADVIESAADRQMAHVRTFAGGKHSETSQRILSEISKAKVCLLNPQEKQAYDQQLRAASARPVLKTRSVPQAQTPRAQPQAQPPAASATPPVAPHRATRQKKQKSTGHQAAIAVGLLVVVVGLAWGIYLATSSDPVVADQESETDTPVKTPAIDPPDLPPTIEPAEKTPPVVVDFVPPTGPDKTPPEDPGTPPPVVDHSSPVPDPPRLGKPIDLLKRIDVSRDALEGDWKIDSGALVTPADPKTARLMVPGRVPTEYSLSMEVERISGDNSLIVGLIAGGKQFESYFDFHAIGRPPVSGVIDGGQPTYGGPLFKIGASNKIQFRVSESRIVIAVDGKPIFDKPYSPKMVVNPGWRVPRKDVLFLGSERSSFRIHKFELTPTGGSAVAEAAEAKEPPQHGNSVDLLKQIDPKRDSVGAAWTLEGPSIKSPPARIQSRLMVPSPVPEEYIFEMEVERLSGDNMILIGLVVGGKQVQLSLDYHPPGQAARTSFYPEGLFATRQGQLLETGKTRRIRCVVTRTRVVVSLDDQVILDQREGFDEMTLAKGWPIPRKDILFLGSQLSSFRIHKVALTPLGGSEAPIVKAKKLPLPYGSALEEAQAKLSDVFKDDLAAARTSQDRIALAKTLLEASTDSKSDPAEAFVMLRAARKLASKAGDGKTAIAAIDRLDEQFAIDAFELKAEALTEVAKSVRLPDDQAALVRLIGPVVLEMVEVDRFELAEPLTKLVQSAAAKSRNVALRKQVAASVKQFSLWQDQYEKVKPALEKLQQTPDDVEANLVVGRYRAFIKHDWPAGLVHLATGSDGLLKSLATQDLAGASTTADQIQLGDDWWKFAEDEAGEFQNAAKTRAGHWYRKSLGGLTGLAKEKIAKRLEQIRQLDPIGRINPDDWIVRCWDRPTNLWKDYPLSKAKTEFDRGILTVTNTTGIHSHAWFLFQPIVADRPFRAVFEMRGQFSRLTGLHSGLGLAHPNRQDRHVLLSSPNDGQWHVYSIERRSNGKFHFIMDGKVLTMSSVQFHHAANGFDGYLGFMLESGNKCSLRYFELTLDPKP